MGDYKLDAIKRIQRLSSEQKAEILRLERLNSELKQQNIELISILNESINIEFVDGEVNRGDEGWWLLENNKWTFSGCFPSPLEAIRELRKLRNKENDL